MSPLFSLKDPFGLADMRGRSEENSLTNVQCTWDPETENSIRLQLVSPKPGFHRGPSLLHINGIHFIQVNHRWAALLRTFMIELTEACKPNTETDEETMKIVLEKTAAHMRTLYPGVSRESFIKTLGKFQDIIQRIARGEDVPELRGQVMSLAQYAKHMRGPLRMDLAVMPMTINGKWACNDNCPNCYASQGKAMKIDKGEELTTEQWFEVLDNVWQIGVPAVSFTGGESLMRKDIVELVAHAQEFTTRLNTNGILLTMEMAQRLREASLDVVQITVYSAIEEVHNVCVGNPSAFKYTIQGIKNALEAGLQVSVNTPLLPANAGHYKETVAFLARLGVRYFSCSGLLPAGGATETIKNGDFLSGHDTYLAVRRAKKFANGEGLELDFTSPGVLTNTQLDELGMNTSVCGACLGNMAISPTGNVIPCQSWVHDEGLGNILTTPWNKIWNSRECKRIRKLALQNICPLSKEA